MTYQVLARKWRPRAFDELVGQRHVVQALVNALQGDRLHHAYLFSGTRGVGKTTVARIFARSLNCETGVTSTPCGKCSACVEIDEGRFVDLIEVDAASRTKVDETRELLENVPYAPTRGRFKVYLIDEVHMFSNHSFNALLKTLEEPPSHVKFLLATTDPKKLPVTILSRCLQFNLKRLSLTEITDQLTKIIAAEGLDHDTAALPLIAESADGSMRDALSLLDQAIAYGDGNIQTADVANMLGRVQRDQIVVLLEAMIDGGAAATIRLARELADLGADLYQALGELLSLLQNIAIAQALGESAADTVTDPRIINLASRISPEDTQLFYQIGLLGRRDLPLAPAPGSGFEMTLLRMLSFRPADDSTKQAGSVNSDAPAAQNTTGATDTERTVPADQLTADGWPSVVESLTLRGLDKQLARNCALVANIHDEITFLLPLQHAQLRNSKAEMRLQQALQARFGDSLRVQITVGEQSGAATPVQQQQRSDAKRQAAAQLAIENDPTVRALRAAFDADIERTDAGEP